MINKPYKQKANSGSIKPGEVRNPNGRPKGSKNKFTKVKEEIVTLWEDADLRGKLISRLKSSEGNHELVQKFVKECIVPVLPKDPQISNTIVNQVDYGWTDTESTVEVCTSELPERD